MLYQKKVWISASNRSVKKNFLRSNGNGCHCMCATPTNKSLLHSKVSRFKWKPGQRCKDRLKYLNRKPGLFETEYESQKMVALGPKRYFCHRVFGNKQVSKGICISPNPLSFEQYHHVLTTNTTLSIENRGFRTKDHQVYSSVM